MRIKGLTQQKFKRTSSKSTFSFQTFFKNFSNTIELNNFGNNTVNNEVVVVADNHLTDGDDDLTVVVSNPEWSMWILEFWRSALTWSVMLMANSDKMAGRKEKDQSTQFTNGASILQKLVSMDPYDARWILKNNNMYFISYLNWITFNFNSLTEI